MAKACEQSRWSGNNFRKVSLPRTGFAGRFPEFSRFRETGAGWPEPPRTPYSRKPMASIGRARSATDVATPIATIPSAAAPEMVPA